MIINRWRNWYEEQLMDQQQGFRKARGTTDGIFMVKQVHQIAKGEAHLMNTEVMHSGVNLSRKVERLHIVGCVNVD